MSESTFGCFGKPSYAWLTTLQRELRPSGRAWADADGIPGFPGSLMSIDTVAIDDRDLPNSISLAVLHSINDIYAAGGEPTSFALSLTLAGRPDLDALMAITKSVHAFSNLTTIPVGKVHTSVECHLSRATVAAVGRLMSNDRLLRRISGEVWLIDELRSASEPTPRATPTWVLERLSLRRFATSEISGFKKDVSGDGLAGAAYQLAVATRCSISLELGSLQSQFAESPLDACDIDRNYADYSEKIQGFKGRDRAWLRGVLFGPQFFGPLICLGQSDFASHGLPIRKIGTFRQGEVRVSLE